MTAKEYLERIRKYDVKIDRLTAIKHRMLERAMVITPSMSNGARTSGKHGDRVGSAAVEIADLEREIDHAVSRYARQIRKTIRLIDQLDKPEYIQLLTMRYVLYVPFDQIARDMGRSVQGVFYMHGRALEAFEQIISKTHTGNHRKFTQEGYSNAEDDNV